MFRSIDAGASWTMNTQPSQEHRISCLTQDSRDGKENIWYFGTGENRGSYLSDVSIYGNGIWKSIDGGLTWDWWNGAVWTGVVGATDYNSATDVNANITSYPTTANSILFKAFL